MPYQAEISRVNKALFVFVIDHSGSMSEKWINANSKAVEVADVLNKAIHNLTGHCQKGEEFRDYFDIAAIGYGSTVESALHGTLKSRRIVSATELYDTPVSNNGSSAIYIEASFDKGGTDTALAFKEAKSICDEWIANHKNSFPPTVIHITDGEYTGNNPEEVANEIKSLATNDGGTLLWNVHISSNGGVPIVMPQDDLQLTSASAKQLFQMSSIIPSGSRHFSDVVNNSRSFAYNATLDDLIKFINTGTVMK